MKYSLIHKGVLATKTPGIIKSKFNPIDNSGFSNSTVIAHIQEMAGTIVTNNFTVHVSK